LITFRMSSSFKSLIWVSGSCLIIWMTPAPSSNKNEFMLFSNSLASS
jgi:hypothetical protein